MICFPRYEMDFGSIEPSIPILTSPAGLKAAFEKEAVYASPATGVLLGL